MTVSADSLDFGPRMQAWAEREASVSGLVLIGSRQRPPGEALEVVESHSDWDFHVITSNPALFANRRWVESWPGVSVRAYAARAAVIGGVAVGLFPDFEVIHRFIKVDHVSTPNPANQQRYRQMMPLLEKSYRALVSVYDDLAKII